ncbi:Parvulin-like PPIase [Seminavis robusta]|uniref:Peptidyl-prolyl cis-trans isomerase n=1 Tax=Seminavis robusta TaxID=568900 RepID=A0A9N8HW08_9STRA|nr:Parvulin-like PPIase [Seminavis robusta]|eukprot:Sro2049_g312550.1 Parvulin-like PPIase (173) ;mRNA; f:8749-9267
MSVSVGTNNMKRCWNQHVLFLMLLVVVSTAAFAPQQLPGQRTTSTTARSMGMFDFINNAFANEAYDDRRATASHILVDSEDEAQIVQKEISEGKPFAEAAKDYSSCPSASKGGSLGTFEPGNMVKEFDDVVFNQETAIGEVVGPVKTSFGYHLIKVEDRFEIQTKTEGKGAF